MDHRDPGRLDPLHLQYAPPADSHPSHPRPHLSLGLASSPLREGLTVPEAPPAPGASAEPSRSPVGGTPQTQLERPVRPHQPAEPSRSRQLPLREGLAVPVATPAPGASVEPSRSPVGGNPRTQPDGLVRHPITSRTLAESSGWDSRDKPDDPSRLNHAPSPRGPRTNHPVRARNGPPKAVVRPSRPGQGVVGVPSERSLRSERGGQDPAEEEAPRPPQGRPTHHPYAPARTGCQSSPRYALRTFSSVSSALPVFCSTILPTSRT